MGFNDDDEREEGSEENYSFEDFYKEIRDKLEDEDTIKLIVEAKRKIEKRLGCPVLISIPHIAPEFEEEIFDMINNNGVDKKTNTLKLGKVCDILSIEDKNLPVYIDPLHLSPGVNPMIDLVQVVMDDYIILVPKNKQ